MFGDMWCFRAALLDRLVAEAMPNQLGVHAWQACLRAHATLMRHLTHVPLAA